MANPPAPQANKVVSGMDTEKKIKGIEDKTEKEERRRDRKSRPLE